MNSCQLSQTKRFSIYDIPSNTSSLLSSTSISSTPTKLVHIGLVCDYSAKIVQKAVKRRPWCRLIHDLEQAKEMANVVQISDFEMIEWEPVLEGKHRASSYIIRKGLSRKAQLALQLKRFTSKNPHSVLINSTPLTLIVETWNAFEEDMKLDLGGGIYTTFDSNSAGGAFFMQSSQRQKLEWSLSDIQEEVKMEGREDWLWILKPSVTNKGTNISVHKNWESILDALEDNSYVREWVLQRYIDNPLTVNGHKFHLRVYVLCVGALQVYVNHDILMLLAAHRYTTDDLEDSLAHLTNTARGMEDENFEEEKFVMLLDDLSRYLPEDVNGPEIIQNIRTSIFEIVHDLYSAYENEYTIFSPLNNCFELYGLDFIIDSHFHTHLLEVNPGPDFKQTGGRLKSVIMSLWENTCQIILDEKYSPPSPPHHHHSLHKVYEKEWSVGKINGGGMKLV